MITQGHRNCRYLIGHISFPLSSLVISRSKSRVSRALEFSFQGLGLGLGVGLGIRCRGIGLAPENRH